MIKEFSEKIKKNKEKIFEFMAIILIVSFAISLCPKELQNDTFYTVTIGKLITENGIDMKDHFSWHEGLPYTYPHWLYDFGMYQIYNLAGWGGIYISTCVFTAILGICIYISNSRLTNNKMLSFAVTIGVLYLLKSYIAARAQLVTFILFILLIYNIEKFLRPDKNEITSNDNDSQEVAQKEKVSKKRHKQKSWYVVAIFVIHILIANLHVAVWPFSFVLYLPYIAEYLIAEIIDIVLYKKVRTLFLKDKIKNLNRKLTNQKLDDRKKVSFKNRVNIYNSKIDVINAKIQKIKEKREKNADKAYKIDIKKNKNVRWLILIMIIALFTGLISPFGRIAYTYTYDTLRGNTMKSINEHLPLTLIKNTPMICTIILILATLTFTRVKIRLSDLFMLGGLCYLMFSSKRQQSMFVLVGSIAFTRMINDLIKMHIKYSVKDIVIKWFNKFTAFVIVAIVVSLSLHLYSKVKNTTYINKNSYPIEASEWMLKNLDVKKIRLFNEYNYGSYLLYKGIPVFIDSRCDLYTPQYNSPTKFFTDGRDIFTDFINASNISSYYGDIFKNYDITHVILYNNSKINMLIKKADSEKYKEIYSDDNFVVYEVL